MIYCVLPLMEEREVKCVQLAEAGEFFDRTVYELWMDCGYELEF